jgi:hypothetical protein
MLTAQPKARLIQTRLADHSGLAPENLTTCAHFSVSSVISLPKSAAEPGMGDAEIEEPRLHLGISKTGINFSIELFSRGVFLGTLMPNQALAWKPRTGSPKIGLRQCLQARGRCDRQRTQLA